MKKHFKPLQNKRDDENISSNDSVEVKSKNDSESQEILSEELIIKKSEVCMASILLFIFSFYAYLLYSRLLGGILFLLFLVCFIKLFQLEKKDIYIVRFAQKICFLLLGTALFILLPLIIIKADAVGIQSGIVWWKAGFWSSMISVFLFCNVFFIETRNEPEVQNKLKASRMILYVAVLGMYWVLGGSYLMERQYGMGEISDIYFIVSLVLWLFFLAVAVLNKIRVNGIYSDGFRHSDKVE